MAVAQLDIGWENNTVSTRGRCDTPGAQPPSALSLPKAWHPLNEL